MNINNPDKKQQLKINKRLPQIHIEQKQIDLFIEWWNKDIRFQQTIPHSFEEGYLKCDLNLNININKFKDIIKQSAKEYKTTYRVMENTFKDFISMIEHTTIHFKFINNNEVYLNTYDKNNNIISRIEFEYGEDKKDFEEEFTYDKMYNIMNKSNNSDDLMFGFNLLYTIIFVTSIWYIATTRNTTKYVYEQKTPVITSRKKNIVRVSDTKVISTPIYDISKIKTKKVDGLIKHRKGWTYSHAFQVHGHYRHYKDGKVIFVNSYIKGKDKEFKPQTIELKPKE